MGSKPASESVRPTYKVIQDQKTTDNKKSYKNTEKVPKVLGGAQDAYSKFKRRYRLGQTEPTPEGADGPRAQERSDNVEEIMDRAPSLETSSFSFNLADTTSRKKETEQQTTTDAEIITTTSEGSFDESFEPKPLETKKESVKPSFYPTRRPPSYDALPPRGADYAPPPRRSFSPTTRPAPAVEVTTTELTNELNEAEKIKSMLKSGAVGNDPRKIKEMLLKMKAAKTAAPSMNQKKIMKDTATTATTTAASVSPTLKTWEPKTWNPSKPYTYSANSVKEEDEEYDEDEYYEGDYDYDESDDEEFKKLSPLGIDPPGTRNRMSSSSSYFRKFAQDNAGSPNFRRPEPKDESAKKANAIFKKYSSLGSTSNDATDNNKENESPASNGGRQSFADVYKKKYGSRKSSYSSTEATPTTASTEKVTYPPRPTPTLRYNRFVPTAKSFKPMFKRVRTTTFSTSPQPTTTVPTTVPTESTTKFVISNFPEPALDTSLFGNDQVEELKFDKSYFDLENSNSNSNSMSVDTSSFELDSMNFEDGESAMAQTDRSSQIISKPFSSSKKMSPVPIRKVLDIFQELRLSFGRS